MESIGRALVGAAAASTRPILPGAVVAALDQLRAATTAAVWCGGVQLGQQQQRASSSTRAVRGAASRGASAEAQMSAYCVAL